MGEEKTVNNFPNKKYGVIYADPPWQYDNKRTGGTHKSGAGQKYRTMNYDELAKLPIQQISDANCILFQWATVPLLPAGINLLSDWGFEYKTSLIWFKENSYGLGYWFRGMTELLLIGTKGKIKPFRAQMPNLIRCPIQKHSKKPDRFRTLIEHLTRTMEPKIELFARTKVHGWDVWGDDSKLDAKPLEAFNAN